MQKYFMLDIETMGTDALDDIIQIGILECIKNGKGFYTPARSFLKVLHTDQEPKDEWIRTNHKDLLVVSKNTEYEAAPIVRAQILAFFKQCGVTENAEIMGLNAGTFDLPFMFRSGYLAKSDVHYRVYELTGVNKLAQDILGVDSRDVYRLANQACDWIDLPAGKKHDAMYDCISQLKALNGTIAILRPGFTSSEH